MVLYHLNLGGAGEPLIILHGLFGFSGNWRTAGQALSTVARVFALDLPNHGDSPHTKEHTIQIMADAVIDWMNFNHVEKAILLGHSMGGLVCAHLALTVPDRIIAPILLDIAYRNTYPDHSAIFRALDTDITPFSSRAEIEKAIMPFVQERSIRQFIMMNLKRKGNQYSWKLNVTALKKSYLLDYSLPRSSYNRPALFVFGSNSEYASADDVPAWKVFFPKIQVDSIPDAGHWLHHTHQQLLTELIGNFILQIKSR